MFLKTIPLSSPCKPQKREFVKMLTLCILRVQSVCVQTCSRVLISQRDIAKYWPGMHNTVFSVIFTNLCKHCFINVVVYTKLFKNTKKNSAIFITSVSYKHTLCFLSKVTKILLPLLKRRHTIECLEKFYSLIN